MAIQKNKTAIFFTQQAVAFPHTIKHHKSGSTQQYDTKKINY